MTFPALPRESPWCSDPEEIGADTGAVVFCGALTGAWVSGPEYTQPLQGSGNSSVYFHGENKKL